VAALPGLETLEGLRRFGVNNKRPTSARHEGGLSCRHSGWGEIRTRETVARPHAFQACALSHSATHPASTTRNEEQETRNSFPHSSLLVVVHGQGEIRTHDTGLPYTGFRDRRLQPLGHLSNAERNITGRGERVNERSRIETEETRLSRARRIRSHFLSPQSSVEQLSARRRTHVATLHTPLPTPRSRLPDGD
jgi:hypothetical protein